MAEDQGVKEVEGQSQPVATPATEQQVPAEAEVKDDAPKGDSPSQDDSDELGLPKDASERTRQRVQELLEENKQLKEAQFHIPEPVYQTPAPLPVGNVPAKTDEFGNVNPEYLDYLEKRVEAREQADYQKSVRSEAQEAETAHPEILKDSELLNMAEAVKMNSIVYPEKYKQKRELTLKEALDFVKGKTGKAVKSNTEEVSQEKEQASLSVEGRPSQAVQREMSDEEFDSLRWATARGDKDAMLARMRNIPPVNRK